MMNDLAAKLLWAASVSAFTLIAYSVAAQTKTTTYDMSKVIDSWTAITGIVVTESAKAQIAEGVAHRFSSAADAAGFTTSETEQLSHKITGNKPLIAMTTPEYGKVGVSYGKIFGDFDSNSASIEFRNSQQEALVWQTFDPRHILEVLNKLPTIFVVVTPVPPRDYRISINGQDVQVTDKSEYGVPRGKVKVSVIRSGKPPCTWAGTLRGSQNETVNCSF